jgi:hypothetical protein
VAGCSVHPLPGDFSRTSTVDIVRSLRCEARDGAESLLTRLTPQERLQVTPIIRETKIGYDFSFTIEESNDAGNGDERFGLRFERSFTKTPSKLDLRGSGSLGRQNIRTFTIIEPLTDLLKPETSAICKDRTQGANWTHPVAGTIGLDELVGTYLKLEVLSELRRFTASEKPFKSGAPGKFPKHVVFSDELLFTTHFGAGMTGTLVLDAVVGRLSLRNASLTAGATRRDLHSVIVALTREKVDVDETVRSGRASARALQEAGAKREGGALANSVRDPRTQARIIQLDAPASESIAIELHQRRARNDEDDQAARALGQRLLDVLRLP